MKRKTLLLFPLLLLCLIVLNGCRKEQPASAGEDIRIGVILPLTGALAHVGEAFKAGALMALADAKRGALRGDYKLIFEDDRMQPAGAAVAAQKLINVDHVAALISTWSYGGSAVSPIVAHAGIPHFGVAWDHTIADGKYSFLHLAPPREFIAKLLLAFARKGYRRIAALGVEESGSIFSLDELERLAGSCGMSVVYREVVPLAERDFRTQLSKLRMARPDVIYANIAAAIEPFMRQAAELEVTTPLVAMTSFDVAENLKPLEGLWYVSDSYLPADFVARLADEYQIIHSYGVGNYYDLVRLIIWLHEKAAERGKPDSAAVLRELKNIARFPSLFGTLNLDDEGIISYPAQYMLIRNGRRQKVALDEIALANEELLCRF